jgi:hypothetical protein
MEIKWKSFYFQEMDWLICFPNAGNEGRKYLFYSIKFIDRKKKHMKPQIILADIVDSQMFENGFPHTVGFFKEPIDKEMNSPTNFLEIRIIRCIEEFWKFLNDLDI